MEPTTPSGEGSDRRPSPGRPVLDANPVTEAIIVGRIEPPRSVWPRPPRAAIAALAIAGLVALGGVALALRGGDGGPETASLTGRGQQVLAGPPTASSPGQQDQAGSPSALASVPDPGEGSSSTDGTDGSTDTSTNSTPSSSSSSGDASGTATTEVGESAGTGAGGGAQVGESTTSTMASTSTDGSSATTARRSATTRASTATTTTDGQTTTSAGPVTTKGPTTGRPSTSRRSVSTTTPTTASTTTTTTTSTTSSTTSTTTGGGAGTVIWQDDFNRLDTSTWRLEHSTYGDGNDELQCYQPGNVSVGGGKLILEARTETVTCPNGSTRQVSSGMVRSQGVTFSPGQAIEFRVKLTPADPNDQGGLWPAVWASGWGGGWPAGGELDWLEVMTAEDPTRAMFSMHYAGPDGGHRHQNKGVRGSANFSDDWHTIRFDYGHNGSLRWYLDGSLGFAVDAADTLQGYPTPFDRTIGEIKINLALGGRPGPLSAGAVASTGATFEVDYIRIIQL